MAKVDISVAQNALSDGTMKGLVAGGMFAVGQVYKQIMSGYGNPIIGETGALIGSLDIGEINEDEHSINFGVSPYYSVYVHDGTYKMIERPFIKDVLEDPMFVDALRDIIAENLQEVFK